MDNLIRKIALFIRQRSEQRKVDAVLKQFDEWRLLLDQLPASTVGAEQKLALVRLDDIGDYLLFRNFLAVYKQSDRFKNYVIVLVGNIVWKPVFEQYDAAAGIDRTIWVDKHLYFSDDAYRRSLWQQIKNENFETVICPSRTRPLLIDDLIALASGAGNKIACENSFPFNAWNKISDQCYDELFSGNTQQHEFFFNRDFAKRVSCINIKTDQPFLPSSGLKECIERQVICFIGASARSKTWPVKYWIELVKLLQKNGYFPVLAGGKNELNIAEKIESATHVPSIVGQTGLVQTLQAIEAATAVITGDTMAAHAGVSFCKPTVILSNGVNAARFVAYGAAGFALVKTIYTRQYLQAPGKSGQLYAAVTKDMASIQPRDVFAALQQLVG